MDTVQEIKRKLDIVDVIRAYVQLIKMGGTYKARCPFHSEKTPSFVVSPVRQSYHCFGCGEHGDMFSFVEKIEGVDFKGALKMLAEKAGVQIVYESNKKNSDEKDRHYELLETATKYFQRCRYEHPEITGYLKERGLTEETIHSFRVGFALPEWRELTTHLHQNEFTEKEIQDAGLSISHEKTGMYDRFRSRIMFPLTDSAGRVIAFSGRIWNGDEQSAKYINSPETLLFHKSNFLYGFDKAKFSIRKLNCAMVVEGQMDLLSCHQVGYSNAVAISGTALTHEHLSQLHRLSTNLILALDADKAGVAATEKSAKVALQLGFDVKVVTFDDGKDVSDLLKNHGSDAIKRAVKDAKPVIEYLLSYYVKQSDNDSRTLVRVAEQHILPLVASIKSKMEQSHTITQLSRTLNISVDSLHATVLRLQSEQIQVQPSFVPAVAKAKTIPEAEYVKAALTVATENGINYGETICGVSLGLLSLPESVESSLLLTVSHALETFGDPITLSHVEALIAPKLKRVLSNEQARVSSLIRQSELERNTNNTAKLIAISEHLRQSISLLHEK